MTQRQAPYDAGLHPGFQPIARCGNVQVGKWNGTVYLLRDDESRDRIRDLPPAELDTLVVDLAQLVAGMRNALVEVYKAEADLPPGPLTLA